MNLTYFTQMNVYHALRRFFAELNIPLYALTELPTTAAEMLTTTFNPKNPAHQLLDDVYLVGGVDDAIFQQQAAALTVPQLRARQYDGLLIFGVTLTSRPTRTQMAEIARAFNREFHYTPVVVVFQYPTPVPSPTGRGEMLLSFASCERLPYQQTWREGEKAGKVSILKDVHPAQPHAGHLRILDGLRIERGGKQAITTFAALYAHWQAVFSVALLNKRFYQELANWYFWALPQVEFPADKERDAHIRNATNLIRLLTRIIFIWFLKEKSLVPETLFDATEMPRILKAFLQDDRGSSYYQAILQNLFFATLNKPMGERAFADERGWPHNRKEFGVKTLMRYADQFRVSQEEALRLFAGIPFLNGGLFDCLDKDDNTDDGQRVAYVDGFSRNPKQRANVPDRLFFMAQEREIDLTAAYDPTAKKPLLRKVRGLFDILSSYKFTVAENTPIEEEIALDPELLGKVFENLLASYNPETQTTARKQTGSFYTPREIVNYMVDESLLAYLTQATQQTQTPQTLASLAPVAPLALETRLRHLLSYADEPPQFSDEERRALIAAINRAKILDPACGSGAFPMGVLHKLVLMLHKLDPDNRLWKAEQRERLIGEKMAELKRDKTIAAQLSDEKVREQAIRAIDDRLREIEAVFDREFQDDDYARKLYLIENGIYGVDIQPIAVQIAKLRCFISLIIDQKPNLAAPNLGLRALPNLETKFVAANTLIGLDKPKGHQYALKNQEIARLEKALKALRHDYFTAKTRHDKLNAQENDAALRQQIARLLVSDGWNNETARQLVAFDPYNQNAFADFFDAEWMFGMQDGFDIVIGNPPYVQLQNNGGQLAQAFKHQPYETFIRTGDIYCLFYEKANQLAKPKGVTCYITSNKWMRAAYGEKLRKYFAQQTQPLKLIDVGPGVFEAATVDTNILLFAKQTAAEPFSACQLAQKTELALDEFVRQFSVTVSVKPNGEKWEIGSPVQQRLTEKIETVGIPLKDWNIAIYFGVKTGYNEAFIIDGAKKAELIAADPKSAEIIKPLLRGREIQPYKTQFADSWLIATFPTLHLNIDNYPSVRDYLRTFGKRLEQTGENGCRKKTSHQWFETQDNIAFYQEFEKEKIVWKRIGSIMRFSYDDSGAFCLDSTCIATGEKIKFLVGVLNSKVCLHELFRTSPKTGTGDQIISVQALEPLRIPQPNAEQEQAITALVDLILAAKQRDPAADTRALEAEIDRLVSALYGLTPEEIAIVEGKHE